MTETLAVALAWLDLGVVPIPIVYKSKRPAIRWRVVAEHKPPAALVKRWFNGSRPLNIGVMCGAVSGGLTVLDFDKPLPYHKWQEQQELKTLVVQTGRGYHVYLMLDDPPNTTLEMAGGAGQVKGSGYVLAPPSVHPSGRLYEVLVRSSVARLPSLADAGVETLSPPTKPEPIISSPDVQGNGLIANIKEALPILILLQRHTQVFASDRPEDWPMALCPLHDDRSPSMWVNVGKGLCGCFSPKCRAYRKNLDVINLYAELHGIPNEQAIFDLAGELGL